jgi:1,4-dihydroxy-2-naphthoate polyprenyltransferase
LLLAFIKLGRPLFLGGGFILYALGAAIARGPIDWQRYALGQAIVTAFQLMTHYANDYFDLAADKANETPTAWSGGSRVLADDVLPPWVALAAALGLAATGGVLALWSSEQPLILVMGALAWCYSGPPLRLCSTGFGELDTAVVVTGLVPLLACRLQGGAPTALFVAAIVPLALLQLAMLLAIEFPDAAGDAATGKRTLVVRLGARRAARLYAAITALAYLWLPVAYLLGVPPLACLLAALPAPLAIWRIARLRDTVDPSAYERLTFSAVALLVATSAGMLAGVLIGGGAWA